MIRHDVEQGSAAWLALRLGMPTASGFDQLITLKKMEPSASARGYRGRLLAEWLIGERVDDDTSAFMERGTGLEDEALAGIHRGDELEVCRECQRSLGAADGVEFIFHRLTHDLEYAASKFREFIEKQNTTMS